MTCYPEILAGLVEGRHRWLITGCAGFIGSHLTEALLSVGQEVTGLDDMSRGHISNVNSALNASGGAGTFRFLDESITDIEACREAVRDCDYVLHHAALASVPESLADPVRYNEVNVSGFVNVLQASREAGVKRVVYASSSAVYGDDETMPKVEGITGKSLSPYASTKYINEIYAEFFTRVYGLECTGLRYFNVFGPRQDPNGAYAAVIPRWIEAVRSGEIPVIYGTGEQTRDFCSVQNVVKANILAAAAPEASGRVFNIGCGVRTSLNELLEKIYAVFAPGTEARCINEAPREGDILHSSASIQLAQDILEFCPAVYLEEGLRILNDYQA
ncbi:MAG: NAD-dependent epimerase/dehydratase family protein [Synergistaceae bacterium]|nr:NAD-dependent epimerase/dehydratase family protein [Synergistaceae bacterium]